MKALHLSKIHQKTEAILKKEGLWPETESEAPVDYSLFQDLILNEVPTEYDLKFNVDFGGSEGIYVDFMLYIWNDRGELRTEDWGTIKTLAASRQTLAMYAALGANFIYYARQELHSAIQNHFCDMELGYEIYSMNSDGVFQPVTLQVSEICSAWTSYKDSYKKVASGEFHIHAVVYPREICAHILRKAFIETGYSVEMADLICLNIRNGKKVERYAYICCQPDRNNPTFEACNAYVLSSCDSQNNTTHTDCGKETAGNE